MAVMATTATKRKKTTATPWGPAHTVEQVTLPADAWTAMAAGQVEHVPLEKLAGRTTAVLLTPYPPGIPLLVPGERIGATVVRFLRHEQVLAQRWPGFTGITHGVVDEGTGHHRTVACLLAS